MLSLSPEVVVPAGGPENVVTLPLKLISSHCTDPPITVWLEEIPSVRAFTSEEIVPVPVELTAATL